MDLHSKWRPQLIDLQTIAVQTFLIIWRLKLLNATVSAVVIGIEFSFVILFVGIGFGIHTHPKKEYYAAPVPVCG